MPQLQLSLLGNQHDLVAPVEQLVGRIVGNANGPVLVDTDLVLVLLLDNLPELVRFALELVISSESRKCP